MFRLMADEVLNFAKIRDRFCEIDAATMSNLIESELFSDKKFTSTTDQGNALESVVRYAMDKSGLFDRTYHNRKNSQHEMDHWGEFKSPFARKLQDLGIRNCVMLGESKNYMSRPAKVDVVYKVESLKLLLGAGIGAYFTRNGVTGRDEMADARAVMKDFHHRFWNTDPSLSVVFTDRDWKHLRDHPLSFNALLFEKLSLFKTMYSSDLTDADLQRLK